jgi:hypothetical protein
VIYTLIGLILIFVKRTDPKWHDQLWASR